MNLKWEASAEPISGVMLFKPFDIETYRSMSEKYDQIDISEKKKFKGRDDYISQNGGPVLSSEEKIIKNSLTKWMLCFLVENSTIFCP